MLRQVRHHQSRIALDFFRVCTKSYIFNNQLYVFLQARPLGKSQEFTEEEMFEAAKDSFSKVRKTFVCKRQQYLIQRSFALMF